MFPLRRNSNHPKTVPRSAIKRYGNSEVEALDQSGVWLGMLCGASTAAGLRRHCSNMQQLQGGLFHAFPFYTPKFMRVAPRCREVLFPLIHWILVNSNVGQTRAVHGSCTPGTTVLIRGNAHIVGTLRFHFVQCDWSQLDDLPATST